MLEPGISKQIFLHTPSEKQPESKQKYIFCSYFGATYVLFNDPSLLIKVSKDKFKFVVKFVEPKFNFSFI